MCRAIGRLSAGLGVILVYATVLVCIATLILFLGSLPSVVLPNQIQNYLMSGSEKLVGKLHGALAVFRKERDDLYRSKELAHERLRLIVEERHTVEKAVNAMQIKLNTLNGKIQGKDETKDLSTLQTEVERLDQEVRKIKAP